MGPGPGAWGRGELTGRTQTPISAHGHRYQRVSLPYGASILAPGPALWVQCKKLWLAIGRFNVDIARGASGRVMHTHTRATHTHSGSQAWKWMPGFHGPGMFPPELGEHLACSSGRL